MIDLSEEEMITQLNETGINVGSLLENKGDWTFEVWETTPGPSANDFIVMLNSRAEFIRALYGYHLGSPIVIDGWEIALHRHPELSLEGVRHAIAEAIHVDADDFEGIAERRRARTVGNYKLGKTRWEWALQYQFLSFDHESDPTITLRLRRDMKEAYVVGSA